mgnify:CR=1 FL=1
MAGSTAAEDPLIGFTDSEGSAQPPTMGKAPLEKSPRATEEAATVVAGGKGELLLGGVLVRSR